MYLNKIGECKNFIFIENINLVNFDYNYLYLQISNRKLFSFLFFFLFSSLTFLANQVTKNYFLLIFSLLF